MTRIIRTLLYVLLWSAAIVGGALIVGVLQALVGHTITFILALAVILWLCWRWAGQDEKKSS